MRTAPDYVTATLLPALVRAGYLFNLLSNRWFGSRTPTRENRSTIPSPRSAAPIPMRLNPLFRRIWRVELRRRPPSIGQPARVKKNATAATAPEPAKLLTTSETRPGIFTVASSLERLETDSPLVPFPVLPIVTSVPVSYLRECKLLHLRLKPIPLGTAFEIRNRFSKRRTYLLEWPLSACRRRYRIGCRRSRGGPLTQTQSPTKSFKPQPTSKTCPSPAIPYSFVAPLCFSYPAQVL